MKNRTISSALILAATVFCLTACTTAFPDDDLDYMWRLDKISYPGGHDLEGNIAHEVQVRDVWFCFARDLVEIRDSCAYGYVGVTMEKEGTIQFDYSMYEGSEDYDADKILATLRKCGVASFVTTFRIDRLSSERLVLSDENCRLFFTRW